MRRTIPYAVAVMATVVVVLGVMVGVGIGQPTPSHGGTPSEVLMQTDPHVCSNTDWGGMAQELTLAEVGDVEYPYHLLVYFTAGWTGLGANETGYLWFNLDGTDTDHAWEFPGQFRPDTTGTVMWTFEDVAAGTHMVYVKSEVQVTNATPGGTRGQASADLNFCALTVMVIPAIPAA